VHTSQYLRGFEDWFMDLAADEKLATALFDAILDINMGICEELLKEVGDDIDVINTSDDLGLQDRLMFSQATYRNLIKPRHKKYFELIHKMSPAKVFFHTCGAVESLVGELIDVGVDILNPVQVSAKGMDPAVLKKKYGKDISFWGAIDTQHLLPHGSPEDVKKEVERMIDVLGADGGYVLCGVHNLQPDVPVENILAMYQHAREYSPNYR
jgi:uroporphyrinogen decarboxylase